MSVVMEPYRVVPRYGATLPMTTLQLFGRRQRATVNVLIDSGALLSVFPIHAAESAEIDLPRHPNQRIEYGVGGSWAYRVRSYVALFGRRIAIDIAFVERLEAPFGILGRKGVFSQFHEIAFLERRPDAHTRFAW